MKRALGIAGGLGILALAALLLFERTERSIPIEPTNDAARAPTAFEVLSSEPGVYPEPAREGSARTALVGTPPRASEWNVLVRVLDHRGEPVADVPVWLRRGRNERGNFRRAARTGAQGWARFRNYRLEREKAPGKRFSIHCELPFLELEPRLLPREGPPTDPIVLRLPPTGSVEVGVTDTDGTSAPAGSSVTLEMIGANEDVNPLKAKNRRGEHALTNAAGRARFDRVPLGRRFEAQASVIFGTSRVQGDGPVFALETARLTLGLGADHGLLGLRAVDEEGEPLAERDIAVSLRWFEGTRRNGGFSWSKLRTRADGTLRVGLEDQPRWERRAITVRGRGSPNDERFGWLEIPLTFPPGEAYLGDIVLRKPEWLMTGRVVRPDGQGVEDARIKLAQARAWGGDAAGNPRSHAGGEFAVRGWVDGTHFVASARGSTGGVESGPVEVTVGEQDVELILPYEVPVTGQILLPDAVDRPRLRLVLEGAGPPREAGFEENGDFRIVATTSGAATLRLQAGEAVLWELDDLFVPGQGELADPRLNPLDLRGQLQVHRLHMITQARPEGLRGKVYYREAGADEEVPWAHVMSTGDRVALPSPHDALDVRIRIAKHRREILTDVRGNAEVVLREPLRVRLVVRAETALPGWPSPLTADLWLDDERPSRKIDEGWLTNARPELRLLVSTPGHLRVRWWQHFEALNQSGTRPIEEASPFFIDVLDVPEEQVFEVVPPAAAAQR